MPGQPQPAASTLYGSLLPYLLQRPVLCVDTPTHDSEWSAAPLAGDWSRARCALEAVRVAASFASESPDPALGCDVQALVLWGLLQAAHEQLQGAVGLRGTDVAVLGRAGKAVAGFAGHAAMRAGSVLEKRHLLGVVQTVDELRGATARLFAASPGGPTPPPLLELHATLPPACDASQWPFFGRLRRDVDVESLAGESSVPPVLLPVQLTLVPDAVASVEEAAAALRHCVQLCTLLGHQRRLLKNTYCLRVALVQHLFTAVLPMPLPLDHPQRDDHCFWASKVRAHVQHTYIDMESSSLIC